MAHREGEASNAKQRSDRFVCIDNAWYFDVRDGESIGPFTSRVEAESELVFYLLENGITVLTPSLAQLDAAQTYELHYNRSVISLN